MTLRKEVAALAILSVAALPTASASELPYTFLDFQFVQKETSAVGSNSPVPGQVVDILTDSGDGVSLAGTMSIRDRFYVGGSFQSSIVDVTGLVTNPLGETDVADNFDLVNSRLVFGYYRELSPNFDVVFELSYDTADYDFGSFAGENFDTEESGGGAAVGFRWNPMPAFELFATSRFSPVGKISLSTNEYESDTLVRTGVRWYFFEDLALGVDYEDGEVETVTISLRFGFGNLPW